MSLLQLAQERFSVRSYTSTPLTEDQLHHVLEAARLAPSACNRQPWHFYVVTSADKRQQLQSAYNREWFATAPCYIVGCICHDEEWVRPSDGHTHGIVDISIAAEHICLAATELGLGTCWVCNFDVDCCRKVLGTPDNVEPAVILPIGHPDAPMAEKKRKALTDITTIL